MVHRSSRLVALTALAMVLLLAGAPPTSAQTTPPPQSKWYLAEGATGGFFEEEILIGNPNATAADIRITFLRPGGGTPATETFTMAATSRKTVRVNSLPGLGNEPALSAVVECTNGLDIVVERTMYWANGSKRGGHNSPAVAAPAERWFLAEGSTGFFDTFVLIANPDTAKAADIKVTFLRQDGTTVAFPLFSVPPSARANIWVNAEVPALANAPFSTIVESTNGTLVFVERAMYFGGSPWEGGHESLGVTGASKSWFFGEGFTTDTASLAFDTFLLLSNPGTKPATATVTFLPEGGAPVVKQYPLLATSRENVWVDLIPDRNNVMASAPFSISVESDEPIVAERAMYWGPLGSWLEAHNTPGLTTTAKAWAFADGAEDGLDATGLQFDSYFLVANTATTTLELRATFMREDGTGIVRTFSIPAKSRFTLNTGLFPELSNQRFATFLEATNDVAFVAERAVYWGTGLFGGHGSTGTPWTGPVATPTAPPRPALTKVQPDSGPTTGGTLVTLTGTDFRAGSSVTFGGVPATQVVVLNATTITAVAPARAVGAADVTVVAGATSTSLIGGFTYVLSAPTIAAVTPSTGPTTGGTAITITGSNFVDIAGVTVGGREAKSLTVVGSTTITAVTAPSPSGVADVVVRKNDGATATLARAFTFTPATATDRILAFGDSNTEGFTTFNCAWVGVPPNISLQCDYDYDAGYPGRLQELLRGQYPSQAGIAVTNAGFGGETTDVGRRRFPNALTPAQDLAVIMEGVNDLNAGVAISSVVSNLRSMVRTAKAAGRLAMLGTVLPCVTVTYDYMGMPLPYTKCDNAAVSSLNIQLRVMAQEEGALLADFHASFLSRPDMPTYLSGDGLHPNGKGYARMADLVRNLIVLNYETIPPVVP